MQHLVEVETLACKIPLAEAIDHLIQYGHLRKSKRGEMFDIFTNRKKISYSAYHKMNWLGQNCKNPPPCFPLFNPQLGKPAAYIYSARTYLEGEGEEVYTWYFCTFEPKVISSRFLEIDEKCLLCPQNEDFARITFYSYS